MQLSRARIQNFRSLRDVTVEFGPHTAFVGGNGAGKSSILKAIEKFYSTARAVDLDDYFGRDQSASIEIELTFSELSAEEVAQFENRVRGGKLVVRRVFDSSVSSGRYHGLVEQNPEFRPVRTAVGANPKRQAYRDLKDSNAAYAGLPNAGSVAAVDEALLAWEANHPEALSLELDDGQFFGFQNAGRGALQRRTSFVFIPAVREAAADAADQKSTAIGKLIEVVVRSAILKRAEFAAFKEEMSARYKDIVSADNMPELSNLAGTLTGNLKDLYSDAEVGLNWRDVGELPVPLPAADVMLSDDGFGGPVDRQGHGLQRAFVLTLLQHLATSASVPMPEDADGQPIQQEAPSLILAIEEPELYQHPTKQRHFAKVLRSLTNAALPGAAGRTQVVFASHSPLFVSLPHADEIRLVRRENCEGKEFKHCTLSALDLSRVALRLEAAWEAEPGTFTGNALGPRLHILGPELSEGFFAKGVVLVEGRSDRAAILATAKLMHLDLEGAGIAVLPVAGKPNLDRPLAIFRELGIPTYVVWDNDAEQWKKTKKDHNLPLARLCIQPGEEVASPSGTVVAESYAHFNTTLEDLLREELGAEMYTACLAEVCESYDLPAGKDQEKMPAVMYDLLSTAAQKGAKSPTMESLVAAIAVHFVEVPAVAAASRTVPVNGPDGEGEAIADQQNSAGEAGAGKA